MQKNSVPTIYIVDDEIAISECISQLVKNIGHNVQIFSTGLDFLNIATKEMCGCLILDLNLPQANGLTIIKVLQERNISIPTILMSGFLSVDTAVRAMKAGCIDVIQKGSEDTIEKLCSSVQLAIARERHEFAEGEKTLSGAIRKSRLTPRELEVLELVVNGKRNKEIASCLGISVGTVELHRAKVMRKLGVTSIADLVRAAV